MGVKVAESVKKLAEESDVIITMVTAPKDVIEVVLGKGGVVSGARKGSIVIDMSTIGPTAAIEVAKGLKRSGINFVDAPVTGSTPKAKTGELTIFVGGERNVFNKVKPVLLAMGTNLQYMGSVGSGQAIKLINNYLIAATLTAMAEGMLLADALKLKRAQVARTLETTPAVSPFLKLKMPFLVNNKFTPLFSLANMTKDLKLAVEESKKGKSNLELLKLVETLHKKGLKLGFGDLDNSAILKVLQDKRD